MELHIPTIKKGGVLIIEDDISKPGCTMKGGRLVCHGDAIGLVGENMNGGEVHIDGDIGPIGNIIHGKIYHKGKLIVDK